MRFGKRVNIMTLISDFVNDKYHFHNYVDVDIEEKTDLPVIDQVAKHFDISYTIRTSDDCYQVVFIIKMLSYLRLNKHIMRIIAAILNLMGALSITALLLGFLDFCFKNLS